MSDSLAFAVPLLDATIRASVPLLLACLAGLFSERSGIINIGLEGKMLIAAFASAVGAHIAGVWVGLCAGMILAIAFAMLHGFVSINLRGNQVISGLAINLLALGITGFLATAWFALGGMTPRLPAEKRFGPITLPGADALAEVPLIGPLYSGIISGHTLIVYVALALVPAVSLLLYGTRFGLRLRAVGENPEAVDTAGLNVTGLRYAAMICCGLLCGLAGTYLATAQSAGFIENMTAGRGFIALAALIFANWRPRQALSACLLFGFLDAGAALMQGKSIPLLGVVPLDFMQALPYVLTVLLLAGFLGRSCPPSALGVPFQKTRA